MNPFASLEDYLALVPSQYRDSPKFFATFSTIVQNFLDVRAPLLNFDELFDLDLAAGKQLDILGEWIGTKRGIDLPINDYYFVWGGTNANGWGRGIWKGLGDPNTEATDLPDGIYRKLLKANALANRWDGSIIMLYEIYEKFTENPGSVIILDNLNMSMTIQFVGAAFVDIPLELAVLKAGSIKAAPYGITINYETI